MFKELFFQRKFFEKKILKDLNEQENAIKSVKGMVKFSDKELKRYGVNAAYYDPNKNEFWQETFDNKWYLSLVNIKVIEEIQNLLKSGKIKKLQKYKSNIINILD